MLTARQEGGYVRFISTTLMVFSLIGATPHLSAEDSASALIILEGSTEVHFSEGEETSQVTYFVRACFPADDLLSQLNNRLVEQGWSLRSESFFNPEIKSSLTRGWVEYLDSAGTESRIVYRWSAHWTNHDQEVVQFTLKYSCPQSATKGSEDSPDCLGRVRVRGVLFDEDAAKRHRQGLSLSPTQTPHSP